MNIDNLKALLQAATPGPWWTESGVGGGYIESPTYTVGGCGEPFIDQDVKLIVAMHAALPALLDRLDKLEAIKDWFAAVSGDDVSWEAYGELEQKASAALAALDTE